MADLNREELRRLARLGAAARLEELRKEEEAIRRAFPDLFGGGRGRRRARQPTASSRVRRRKRARMSAAKRRAVSVRMKKYWAARRKEKASK